MLSVLHSWITSDSAQGTIQSAGKTNALPTVLATDPDFLYKCDSWLSQKITQISANRSYIIQVFLKMKALETQTIQNMMPSEQLLWKWCQ